MDFQNVKELTITEGDVKTIHDSNGNLLWGALAYEVKYQGDTTQQTYSGKNKLSYTLASLKSSNTSGTWSDNVYEYNGITYTVNDDLTVNVAGATAVNAPSHFVLNSAISLASGTEYVLNGCPAGGSAVGYSIRLYDSGTYVSDIGSGVSFTYGTQSIVRINVAASISMPTGGLLFSPMIRLSTVVDSGYEPYVGGTPAPNPSYPQTVNVVTGTQTITLTDGDSQTETYTVNLGSIELCKIGNYQDYIYKSGDNWYLHKEIGKVVIDENTDFSYSASLATVSRFTFNSLINTSVYGSEVYSNYFIWYSAQSTNSTFNNVDTEAIHIRNDLTGVGIKINSNIASDSTSMANWLANHNVDVYYILATSTDTQITNITLIDQLNNIYEWTSRYGYNFTVNGNLPIIISQTLIS